MSRSTASSPGPTRSPTHRPTHAVPHKTHTQDANAGGGSGSGPATSAATSTRTAATGTTTTAATTATTTTKTAVGPNDAAKTAAASCGLGLVMGVSTVLVAVGSEKPRQIALYTLFLALFHFLEYWVTAAYNPDKLSFSSFLFNNGWQYTAAQALALSETVIEAVWFSTDTKSLGQPMSQHPVLFVTGMGLAVAGQALRTLAMIHAASNFSHILQYEKSDDHTLVTSGVYSVSRHPSYAGYFYWAVGLQVALCNPVSAVVFAGALWYFFYDRIQWEEQHLVRFFGSQYEAYRRQTPVLIPFL